MSKKISPKDGDRFDWFAILDEEFIDVLSNKVVENITYKDNPRGISKEDKIVRHEKRTLIAQHLISALYAAYCTATIGKKDAVISVIKDTNFYSATPTKNPNKIQYSWIYFNAVYESLKELNWIQEIIGREGKGYTRIYAINELKHTFESVGVRWCKQHATSIDSLIVLRDKDDQGKKFDLPTPETEQVRAMSEGLYQYNTFLTQHCVALEVDDEQLYEIAKSVADNKDHSREQRFNRLDLSKIQLKRIFSRGDMNKGGRFYHGWWQSIPSIYRPHITIDTYKTSEVDFSTMSLRIVYALSKREAPDIAVDLYDIGLTDWQGSQDPRRKPIKKYINALMNDEKGTFRLDKDSLALIGLSQKQLKDKVLDAHAPIADKLVAGIGLNTQYIDSQIAEDVMHTLMYQGVVVLPIHDSFIIRTGYQLSLENAMQRAFNKLTGANISVDADEPRLPTHFGFSKEEMLAEEQSLKNNPSSFVTNLADSKLSELIQDSIMSSYIQGWEQWRSGS